MLELFIIEIPKARRILEKEPNNTLAQWVMFLNDPNESEVSKIMDNNEEIKEAMEKLEVLSNDEELRRVAELKEKAIRDEQNMLRHAIQQGIKEGKLQDVLKMLELNMSIEDIEKITGLTKEEIIKLKN